MTYHFHAFLTPQTKYCYIQYVIFSSVASVTEETDFELLKFIYYLLELVHYESKEVLRSVICGKCWLNILLLVLTYCVTC